MIMAFQSVAAHNIIYEMKCLASKPNNPLEKEANAHFLTTLQKTCKYTF